MIAGRTGTVPVGLAVTMGIKTDRGVQERDRFHLMDARETDGKRGVHPAFAWFARLPREQRLMLECTIAHATWDDALRQQLYAHAPPQGASAKPPGRRPWCTGDGRTAMRWLPDPKDANAPPLPQQIVCLGDKCRFRQRRNASGVGVRPDCGAMTVLRFRLSFPEHPEVPTPIAQFASKGEATHDAILGLKEDLDKTAAAMGVPDYSPLGYRFVMRLVQKKHAPDAAFPRGRAYYAVEVSPVVSAADFLARFLSFRRLTADWQTANALPALGGPISDDDVLDAHRASSP